MGADVTKILDELGIQYHASGEEAKALCPNPRHVDRHPSWYINLDSGVHICFSCGYKGPLVRLVRDLRKVGEDEAALWVRTRSSGRLRGSPAREEGTEPEAPRITEASLALFTSPPERKLQKRGISSDSADSLGILWDAGNDSWILPFRDADGTLHGWQSKETRGSKRVRNHPTGIEKSHFLFGLHRAGSGRGVLVESPLDVAVLRDAGVPGGVASYGVRVSRIQLSLLAEHFQEVILALDNDQAGWHESEKLRKEFRSVPVKFFDYEGAGVSYKKDPGEMSPLEIMQAVDGAIPALTMRF